LFKYRPYKRFYALLQTFSIHLQKLTHTQIKTRVVGIF